MIVVLMLTAAVLAFLLGAVCALLYLTAKTPSDRKKTPQKEIQTPQSVKEFMNFLTYDGTEQE